MILPKARKINRRNPPAKQADEKVDDKVDNLPKKTQSKYNSLKDKEITSIELFRAPIQSVIKKILDVASPGLKELQKKLGYDNLYHLGMIVNLKNDRKYIIEKDENILIVGEKSYPQTEKMMVPVKAKITIKSMFNNALKGMRSDKFYSYNFETNNCQTFIKSLLKYSGLLTGENSRFIEQDIPTLVQNMPDRVKDVANLTTDIASILDRFSQNI